MSAVADRRHSSATTSLPTCTLTVYSRPLNYDVVRHGPDLHGYLDLTSPLGILIFEGLHIGSLIKAGGGPLGVFDPNKPSQDTNDGSITGTYVCGAAGILESDVWNINNAKNITYEPLGPNSNSVLRYMLQSINYLTFPTGLPWYTIPITMQFAGYYVLLPGVETPAPSWVNPYPGRGRRIPLPGRPHRHLL